MGADFLFSTWSIRKGKSPADTRRRAVKMLDEAKERIGKLTKIPSYLVDQGDYNDDELERAKSDLLSDVEAVHQAFIGNDRESGILCFGDYIILITGGMSWGDPPTELFDSIDRLVESGLLDDERPRGSGFASS